LAKRDLAFHHGFDVVTHETHCDQKRAKFIGRSMRNWTIELPVRDLARNCRCGGDWASDTFG
jgi:hypothetical protein